MPCNAAHFFAKELQKATKTPFLNMLEETAQFIAEKQTPKPQKVGLLATNGTIMSRIYHDSLAAFGIELVSPSTANQELVMQSIYQVKQGRLPSELQSKLEPALLELKEKGAELTILGCTELPLIFTSHTDHKIMIDPMRILAQKIISLYGKKLRY